MNTHHSEESKVALTFDVDWAPDFVIDFVACQFLEADDWRQSALHIFAPANSMINA